MARDTEHFRRRFLLHSRKIHSLCPLSQSDLRRRDRDNIQHHRPKLVDHRFGDKKQIGLKWACFRIPRIVRHLFTTKPQQNGFRSDFPQHIPHPRNPSFAQFVDNDINPLWRQFQQTTQHVSGKRKVYSYA